MERFGSQSPAGAPRIWSVSEVSGLQERHAYGAFWKSVACRSATQQRTATSEHRLREDVDHMPRQVWTNGDRSLGSRGP